MHPISFFVAIFWIFGTAAFAQRIATFEVDLSKPTSGLQLPAKADLDGVTSLPDSVLSLVEVQGNKRTSVPFQIENKEHRALYWMVNSNNDKTKKRIYELVKGASPKNANVIEATTKDGVLVLHAGNRNLLQ